MAYIAGEKYDARVVDARLIESKEKKTAAIWYRLETEQGRTEYQEYVTENTSHRIAENMWKVFGVTREQLASMEWLDNIGDHLRNKEVSIVMGEEEQKDGTMRVIVKWLNSRGAPKIPASISTKANVSRLFGGQPQSVPKSMGITTDPWLSDSEAEKW